MVANQQIGLDQLEQIPPSLQMNGQAFSVAKPDVQEQIGIGDDGIHLLRRPALPRRRQQSNWRVAERSWCQRQIACRQKHLVPPHRKTNGQWPQVHQVAQPTAEFPGQ